MDLQERITALEAEKKQYINMIDNINAEKIALDQMYVNSLKDALNFRKENILLNQNLNSVKANYEEILKEKELLQKRIEDLNKRIELNNLNNSTEL